MDRLVNIPLKKEKFEKDVTTCNNMEVKITSRTLCILRGCLIYKITIFHNSKQDIKFQPFWPWQIVNFDNKKSQKYMCIWNLLYFNMGSKH